MSRKDDDELGAMLLGGVIGAILAAPKPEEKQELQEYRNFKQQVALRRQKIGNIPSLQKLMAKPSVYNAFTEAVKMYMFGFFRGSAVLCSAIIEALLKEKFGDDKFYDLIEKAKGTKLLAGSETHYLHALRLERNDFAHNVLREVNEDDALLVLKITNKIVDKLS
jgi:hypothetical protein